MTEIIKTDEAWVICPVCGMGHMDPGIVIVPSAGVVSRNGQQVRLGTRMMELFMILHRRAGMIIERETLMDQLYQLKPDEPDMKVIDVMVCKLRRALQPLGMKIITAWGTGYALDLRPSEKGKVIEVKETAP
jgi:DNA-binding response OmpR family regulator